MCVNNQRYSLEADMGMEIEGDGRARISSTRSGSKSCLASCTSWQSRQLDMVNLLRLDNSKNAKSDRNVVKGARAARIQQNKCELLDPVVAEATLDFRNLNKRKLLTNFPTFLPQKFEKSFLSVFPALMSLGSFVQLFPSLVDLPSKFVFQAWLLILYIGLALRENILTVNGSDIRPWVDKTSLLRNGHGTYQSHLGDPEAEGCNCSFNGLSCKELQCFYKIDINVARRMDVVWGETAGVDGQLWLLAPILFILQGFEAYIGILLLKVALAGVVSEWQVVACGVLLIVMAVGNFANAMQTLVAKSRFKAKMKKTKSKLELN
ncbi:unnamed protein product [Camellia sinensis]